MAIVTIDNLPVADSVSTGDTLIINTATGAKQIDASAVGGGDSNVAVITFNYNNGTVQTTETCGEIKALVEAGKAIIGVLDTPTGVEGLTAHVQISVALSMFSSSGNSIQVIGIDGQTSSVVSMTFVAATDDNVFQISQS